MSLARPRRAAVAAAVLLGSSGATLAATGHGQPAAGAGPILRFQDEVTPERMAELAERCGSRVAWAEGWEDAVKRSKRERKPILAVAYLYGNVQLGVDLTSIPLFTTFAQDEIVELVNERFVPLWFRRGDALDFEDEYGMGPLAFGKGLFVLEPDGAVLAEFESVDSPLLVDPFLRGVLGPVDPPKERRVRRADPEERVEYAAEHARRGELEAALVWLEEIDSAAGLSLLGDVHARLRHGERALEAWAAARAADGSLDLELSVRESAVRTALGQIEVARTDLARALASEQPAVRAAALSLAASLDLADGDRASAERHMKRLMGEHPDEPVAWAAAGLFTSGVLDFIDGPTDPRWPAAERVASAVDPSPPAPLGVKAAGAAIESGLDWLVANQRDNWTWSMPHVLRDEPLEDLHAFTEAATAVAYRALLLADGDDEGARRARAGALEVLVDRARARLTDRPDPAGMDYTPWANAMLLETFTAGRRAGELGASDFAQAIGAIGTDLESRVQRDGGWGYYAPATGDPANSPSISMSFTTAAVLQGLVDARAAGAEGLDDLIDGASDALDGMRSGDGWYAYSAYEGQAQIEEGSGATGRGPVCELALWSLGDVDADDLSEAVDRFFEGLPLIAAESGKVLMHCGPGGLGCHYVLFDYLGAARAMSTGTPQPRNALTLIEYVLELRREDGSFIDTPIIGASYGTAAAILALESLRPPKFRR